MPKTCTGDPHPNATQQRGWKHVLFSISWLTVSFRERQGSETTCERNISLPMSFTETQPPQLQNALEQRLQARDTYKDRFTKSRGGVREAKWVEASPYIGFLQIYVKKRTNCLVKTHHLTHYNNHRVDHSAKLLTTVRKTLRIINFYATDRLEFLHDKHQL